jgi:nicotinamidase/pyrazinamidase
MKALIVVDMQEDFLPGGALGVPEGDAVIPEIVRLMEAPGDRGYGVIVTTQDLHPAVTKHFDKWPAHCVRGTAGAALDGRIAQAVDDARERGVEVFHIAKGQGTEDDGYSGFEGTTLDGRTLADVLGENPLEGVDVVGLATDYCVKATAIDAAEGAAWPTRVLLAATRPVDAETGNLAVLEMQNRGVTIAAPCWDCGGTGVRCCEQAADRP